MQCNKCYLCIVICNAITYKIAQFVLLCGNMLGVAWLSVCAYVRMEARGQLQCCSSGAAHLFL